jgi:uncharacterized surface protein with fasciclin (FAS1) repeats
LKKAKLIGALKKGKNLTVFAPTNAAFAKLDKELVEHLMSPKGRNDLKDILLYHVVGNEITSDKLLDLPLLKPYKERIFVSTLEMERSRLMMDK